HHLGVKSWKQKYPDAKIVSVQRLVNKKREENITIDYVFKDENGNRVIDGPDGDLNLPRDLTQCLSFVYLPGHGNNELIVFHKASKSLIEADLFLNLPCYEQYQGCTSHSATGGFSFLLRFVSGSSWFPRWASRRVFKGNPHDNAKGIRAVYDLGFDRIIPCHG